MAPRRSPSTAASCCPACMTTGPPRRARGSNGSAWSCATWSAPPGRGPAISPGRRPPAGGRGGVLVAGGAGVGKPRLVTEVAELARRQGAVVVATQCFAAPGRLALAPVADWLRDPAVRAAAATLDPAWRAEVARLGPARRAAAHDPRPRIP